MTISLSEAGKRYNREWIFRKFSYDFQSGISYAINGPNGSGKSTLLQAIAGAIHLSEGKLLLQKNGQPVDPELFHRELSIATPYLELIEEMTALELIEFQSLFKPFLPEISPLFILSSLQLDKAANKQVRFYSSGMKQRLKLALAVFADTPILLLDEPCTNLDASGITVYRELVQSQIVNRIVIISSNDPQEYDFCQEIIQVKDYKS